MLYSFGLMPNIDIIISMDLRVPFDFIRYFEDIASCRKNDTSVVDAVTSLLFDDKNHFSSLSTKYWSLRYTVDKSSSGSNDGIVL